MAMKKKKRKRWLESGISYIPFCLLDGMWLIYGNPDAMTLSTLRFTYRTPSTGLVDHKASAENYSWFVDVVVFVTEFASVPMAISSDPRSPIHEGEHRRNTYLKVPTPPASRIKDVSCNGFPVHRIASARRIWPCATISTSPSSSVPKHFRWYFSLISVIKLSSRRVTSSGDLLEQPGQHSIHRTPALCT